MRVSDVIVFQVYRIQISLLCLVPSFEVGNEVCLFLFSDNIIILLKVINLIVHILGVYILLAISK